MKVSGETLVKGDHSQEDDMMEDRTGTKIKEDLMGQVVIDHKSKEQM